MTIMKEDEKRYTDAGAELVRTYKQGISNNLHDNIVLDSLDWSILE